MCNKIRKLKKSLSRLSKANNNQILFLLLVKASSISLLTINNNGLKLSQQSIVIRALMLNRQQSVLKVLLLLRTRLHQQTMSFNNMLLNSKKSQMRQVYSLVLSKAPCKTLFQNVNLIKRLKINSICSKCSKAPTR